MIDTNFFSIILLSTFGITSILAFMKYSQTVEAVRACSDPKYANVNSGIRNIKLIKINRTTRAINADISFKIDIDDKIGGTIKFVKLNTGSGGDATELSLIPVIRDPCNAFKKHFSEQLVALLVNLGVKHPDRCPIPAGNYSFKNLVLSTVSGSSGIAMPMAGRFLFRTVLLELATNEIIVCLESLVESQEIP